MSRRTQPVVITVICDGCNVEAAPDPLGILTERGWTISFDEPSGCDWCPTCTSARSDLQVTIQRVRAIGERTKALYRDERDYDDGWNACREAVLDALDGGAE